MRLAIPFGEKKQNGETIKELIIKFFSYSKELRNCRKALQKAKRPEYREILTDLMDYYGNEAQIYLFKLELFKIYLTEVL